MARCPQNKGKGKGGSRPMPSGFTGWTLPAPAPIGAEQQPAGNDGDRIPWDYEALDVPHTASSSFMMISVVADPTNPDPTCLNDSWLQSSSLQLRPSSFATRPQQLPHSLWATDQAQPIQPPDLSASTPAPRLDAIDSNKVSSSFVPPSPNNVCNIIIFQKLI